MNSFLNKLVLTILISILFITSGCSTGSNQKELSVSQKDFAGYYKFTNDYAGFIPQELTFDIYASSWLNQVSELTNFKLDNESELKSSLSDYSFEELLSYQSDHPLLINIFSYVQLSSDLNIKMPEQTKTSIIEYLSSHQNKENGLFIFPDSHFRDTFTTITSIEILNLLKHEVSYKTSIQESMKSLESLDKAKLYYLMNEKIPTEVENEITNNVNNIKVVDNLEKLYNLYASKKFLSKKISSDISIETSNFREPRALYELVYVMGDNIPDDFKNEVNTVLYNKSATIGWGQGSELSILHTYYGVIISEYYNSEINIDINKIQTFYNSYIDNLYASSVENNEILNSFNLQDLLYIIKSPIVSDSINKKIKTLLEKQSREFENINDLELILEIYYLTNNDELLNKIKTTAIELSESINLNEVYLYTLQKHSIGHLSKSKKKEIETKLNEFKVGNEYFFTDMLGSSNSIEGLFYAVKIMNVLEADLNKKKNITKSLNEIIENENNFQRLGVLIDIYNNIAKL